MDIKKKYTVCVTRELAELMAEAQTLAGFNP